jgi:hypothetical protein
MRSGTIFFLCWFSSAVAAAEPEAVRAKRGPVARRLRGSRLLPSSSGGFRATKESVSRRTVLLPQRTQA